MKETVNGWIIKNDNHPTGVKPFIVVGSFQPTRKQCIHLFAAGTNTSWRTWKERWNFECVRAKQTTETIQLHGK